MMKTWALEDWKQMTLEIARVSLLSHHLWLILGFQTYGSHYLEWCNELETSHLPLALSDWPQWPSTEPEALPQYPCLVLLFRKQSSTCGKPFSIFTHFLQHPFSPSVDIARRYHRQQASGGLNTETMGWKALPWKNGIVIIQHCLSCKNSNIV